MTLPRQQARQADRRFPDRGRCSLSPSDPSGSGRGGVLGWWLGMLSCQQKKPLGKGQTLSRHGTTRKRYPQRL
jgi:hypothetical protein